MGMFYSHLVFQPPSPPSYSDHDGIVPSPRKASVLPSNDVSSSASTENERHRPRTSATLRLQVISHHPITYLTTSCTHTIASMYFHHPEAHFTILFSHGNGEDLGMVALYSKALASELSANVLCYDYSGYGLSTGRPSENALYANITAAHTHLIHERAVDAKRLILLGRSLGSGPTIELATRLRDKLAGVILVSALTSVVRVAMPTPFGTPPFDMFANVDKISKVSVPVCCVHGMDDTVVPVAHGRTLSRRARYALEPLWVAGAGHNDLEGRRFRCEVFMRYRAAMRQFKEWKAPR